MTQLPKPLREFQWHTGYDATGYYVEGRLAWRGEHCDFRTYLGDREEHVTDCMIKGAIRKVTMELAMRIEWAYPEDMDEWREAIA